jgi:hypothetical protein
MKITPLEREDIPQNHERINAKRFGFTQHEVDACNIRESASKTHHGGRRVVLRCFVVWCWVSGLGIGFWLRGVQP